MFVTNYIVSASSFDPIDLMSLLVAKSIHRSKNEECCFTVILEDDNKFFAEPRSLYSHRFSLPSFVIRLDSQNNLKQLYHMITGDPANNVDSITRSSKKILKFLELPERLIIQKKLDTLAELLTNSPRNTVEQMQLLLGSVLQDLLGNVTITPLSQIQQNVEGVSAIKSALSKLQNEISKFANDGCWGFHKGGKILVLYDNDWIEFERGKKDGNNVYLISSCNRFEVPWYSDGGVELASSSFIRLKGPLILANLIELGKGLVPHLPWYCEVWGNSSGYFRILEFITPVTVVSCQRVSKSAKGIGRRLKPSGYSLLDFYHESASIRKYVNDVAGLDCDQNVSNWIEFANSIPTSKQKGAKGQLVVSKYVEMRLDSIRMLAASNFAGLSENQPLTEVSCGEELLLLIVSLEKVRKVWVASIPPDSSTIAIRNWISDDSINIDTAFNEFLKICDCSKSWRNRISPTTIIDEPYEKELERIRNVFSEWVRLDWRIGSCSDKSKTFLLTIMISFLYSEVKHYYSLVLAIITTALKSTAWSMWLLNGGTGTDEIIGAALISKREIHMQEFYVRFWEES